ncbi:MAG: hypothetical protein RLZZ436_2220 [Planctomycetota bacterium]|jgi:tetratricopeptide (TPR) repeat protein
MAVNPYSLCPCGSGKKFKFCCQDVIADLQRIVSLSRNQPEVGLVQMQQLAARHPDRESVVRELIVMLLRFNRVQEALRVCTDFLKTHPDNPATLLIYADICLQASGFEASRRIVHRAFQVCTRQFPREVAQMAGRIGNEFLKTGRMPAAREHFLLSMRLFDDEEQNNAWSAVTANDNNSQIPILFRTNWPLLNFEAPPEILQQHERALRLCRLGCWEPAAIIYNRLADQAPTNSAIWYNLGLCQMWDGRHAEAAASLHHAASLTTDFDEAAEIEALSQILDPKLLEDGLAIVTLKLNVRSVSELISRLEAHPAIIVNYTHDHSECSHSPGTHHAAELLLLSGPSPKAQDATAENLAHYLADVDVFDITNAEQAAAAGIQHPQIEITCSNTVVDQVIVTLRDCVGDLIISGPEDEKPAVLRDFPRFTQAIEARSICPDGLPERDYQKLVKQLEARALESCLTQPHPILARKSFVEAAADPNLHKQVAGAAWVLEALANTADFSITADSIRSRLNLPSRTLLPAAAAENVAALSILAVSRLPLTELTNEQLLAVISRSAIPGARLTLKHALDVLIARGPEALGPQASNLLVARATIARSDDELERALSLIDQARNAAEGREDAFRVRLELDIRELAWRLENPADSGIVPLLHKIRDLYLRKIPDLAELIHEQLESAGCSHLSSEITVTQAAPQSPIWKPGATAPAAPGPGSLWLPGQR